MFKNILTTRTTTTLVAAGAVELLSLNMLSLNN